MAYLSAADLAEDQRRRRWEELRCEENLRRRAEFDAWRSWRSSRVLEVVPSPPVVVEEKPVVAVAKEALPPGLKRARRRHSAPVDDWRFTPLIAEVETALGQHGHIFRRSSRFNTKEVVFRLSDLNSRKQVRLACEGNRLWVHYGCASDTVQVEYKARSLVTLGENLWNAVNAYFQSWRLVVTSSSNTMGHIRCTPKESSGG